MTTLLARRNLVVLAILCLLVLSNPNIATSAPQASLGASGWWDTDYSFRRSLTLSNPSAQPLVNQPFFINLNFPPTHLVDASTELRFFNANGTEAALFVIDEIRSQGFVQSALLMVVTSLPASSSTSFELYYGNALAKAQTYRAQPAIPVVSAGLHSISQLSVRPGSTAYELSYGNTYIESVLPKISYAGAASGDYGTIEVSRAPLLQLSTWREVANLSSTLTAAASTSVSPNIRLNRISVLSDGGILTVNLLQNSGQSVLDHVHLTELLNASQLAGLSPAVTQVDTASGALITSVGGAFVGYEGSLKPNGYDVGLSGRVLNETRVNTFGSQVTGFGQVAGALSWDLGSLQPGASTEFRTLWTVSSSSSSLLGKLQAVHFSPTFTVGAEETVPTLLPKAELFWHNDVALHNVSMPAGGLSYPFRIAGGSWIPDSATFTGTLSSYLPALGFAPSAGGGWIEGAQTKGNATAGASGSFWSVSDSQYIGRAGVSSLNTLSSGTSNLTSPRQVVFGDNSPKFLLRYRANFAGVGSTAAQSLFAAIDLDHTFSGKTDQTLLFPLIGTSTTNARCPSGAASPLPQAVVNAGFLIADGTWRTVRVDLAQWTGPSGFAFQVRFCTSINTPFVGNMELDLSTATIALSLPAAGVVVPNLDPVNPTLRLDVAGGYTSVATGALVEGDLTFLTVQKKQMPENGGQSFAVQTDAPTSAELNASATPYTGVTLGFSSSGIRITSHYSSLAPAMFVGGSVVPGTSAINGSIYAPGSAIAPLWPNLLKGNSLGVRFAGYPLAVSLFDTNGDPVAGVNVTVLAGFPQAVNSSLTNGQGVASFKLVPWDYNVTALYQGTVVATTLLTLNQSSSTTMKATVFRSTLVVTDALGSPLPNVLVTVTSGNSAAAQGVTDSRGTLSFQAARYNAFHVTVSTSGSTYYSGDIVVSVNNGAITLKSSYYPVRIYEAVIVLIVVLAIISIAGYTLLRARRNRTRY
ncbi:MAG: carboxypeptidase-like regulatory domain-containing protein [Thaumarchaeota archaeon]|nr:carboxypeptidase-like regulatory domain-containing protein [Nitrososphaerota archaeon]